MNLKCVAIFGGDSELERPVGAFLESPASNCVVPVSIDLLFPENEEEIILRSEIFHFRVFVHRRQCHLTSI